MMFYVKWKGTFNAIYYQGEALNECDFIFVCINLRSTLRGIAVDIMQVRDSRGFATRATSNDIVEHQVNLSR